MAWGVRFVMHQEGAWRNIKSQHRIVTKTYLCNKKSKNLPWVRSIVLLCFSGVISAGEGTAWGERFVMHGEGAWRNIEGQHQFVTKTLCDKNQTNSPWV
jgi:hypothetical protein